MDERTWNNVKEKWIPEVKHEQPNVPIVVVGLDDDDVDPPVDAPTNDETERPSIETIVSLNTAVNTTAPSAPKLNSLEKKKVQEEMIKNGREFSKQIGASYMFCTMDKKDPNHSIRVKEVFDEACTVGFEARGPIAKAVGRITAKGRRLSWLR